MCLYLFILYVVDKEEKTMLFTWDHATKVSWVGDLSTRSIFSWQIKSLDREVETWDQAQSHQNGARKNNEWDLS